MTRGLSGRLAKLEAKTAMSAEPDEEITVYWKDGTEVARMTVTAASTRKWRKYQAGAQ